MAPAKSAPQPSKPLFPQLSGGPRRMPAEQVAEHQRARLEGAMVEAVARHGYAGTTLRELVALAGVSKTTFYDHFESKEECFLATFDAIIAETARRAGAAYRGSGGFREGMTAGLSSFMDLVVEDQSAASLAVVESLTLGMAGVAHRERASEIFEAAVRKSFEASPGKPRISPVTVCGIVNGVNGVVYRRLRSGRAEELPGLVDTLIEWALTHTRPDTPAVQEAVAAAEAPTAIDPARFADPEKPDWEDPPDSRLSRTTLSQRQRIVRAAARVVVEDGYGALSIPAISAAAGTSNQTFYQHFSGKRDAFLAAFEIVAGDVLGFARTAFKEAEDGPAAIGIGIRALTERIASHRIFARLAFFELPTAGPVALDRSDAIMDRMTAYLSPGKAPSGIGGPVTETVREAIGSGIWAVIQREIANDRVDSLPDLAPEITRLALAPLQ